MKILAVEASRSGSGSLARYRQVEALGVELYVLNGLGLNGLGLNGLGLNGLGDADFWPSPRYRVAGSKDIDTIIQQAQSWHDEHRFDGVIAFTESSVLTVAAVAEELRLPGIGTAAALASRNKLVMREAHRRAGAPHPAFRHVTTLDGALAHAADLGYPVILKPAMGAGSNFVFQANTAEQLRACYPSAEAGAARMPALLREADGLDLGPLGMVLESFLDGPEYLVEATVWDGEVFLGSIVDRLPTGPGEAIDRNVHYAPTALTAAQIEEVRSAVSVGARGQLLRRSTLQVEIKFHQGTANIIEIGARIGGGGLDYMARLSAGHDPISTLVDVARGVRPTLRHYRPTGVHTAEVVLLCGAGQIKQITVPAGVTESPRLFFFALTAGTGDLIKRPPVGNDVLGYLGATGTTAGDALATAEELAAAITVQMT